MMYAQRRDVVPASDADGLPDPGVSYTLLAGQVTLRRDKRARPLVLRVNAGDCLHVRFTNLLSPTVQSGRDEQPATRNASIHFVGLEAVKGIVDMGSNVGQNPTGGNGIVPPNGSTDYWLYGSKEGTYIFDNNGAMVGGEHDAGSISAGLFGAVNVEPTGSVWYRSQVTRDDLNLARTNTITTADSFPVLNYAAVYPTTHRYANKPILLMKQGNEIVHTDLTAIIAGPAGSGYLIPNVASTKTYPNRNQPFREFTIIFHDETAAVQAFPQFQSDALSFTLHSVRDSFAINYGTGGIGAEILANRVGVGPARDCPECMYEEFFLSSWALGDPAMIVDKPANAPCTQAQLEAGTPGCYTTNVAKATVAFYPDDPSNVYHSYMSDHVKFRNLHAGTDDHHIFHLHAHQWLHSPNSDTSAYKDSQSIGQGAGYTYEIAYGGSGNRNKTVGDSIFHCHFYPHFAQGMWSLWRVHDVLEMGTRLDANGRPASGSRALPDNEIAAGTPIPGLVPIPILAMAPLPGPVSIVAGQVVLPMPVTVNPGYPFFVPGRAGRRPPHPPLDFALDGGGNPIDGGLPRHIVLSGSASHTENRFNFEKHLDLLNVQWLAEGGEPVEKVAMNFHATPGGAIGTVTPLGAPASFRVNGHPAQHGAPYADPCFDDAGNAITTVRNYKAADVQLDVKLNKGGWHYPQSRMLALWGDVNSLLAGTKAPEPFFFRANSGECIEYWHTNLAPNKYLVDDFQVTTPTDILGQHIHLVKFDVTSSDGSGNGWNYEDGTYAGQEVQERICAIRQAQPGRCGEPLTTSCNFAGTATVNCPVPKVHPFFSQFQDADCNGVNDFLGAQTTVQRWWADPITNQDGTGRTLRTIFTHDHFGPSTHQQTGLYAGLVIEPKGSSWFQNETGVQLGTNSGTGLGQDGGPTSWQAVIQGSVAKDNYREFMLEFADFQPAYTPGGPTCPSRDLNVGFIDPARAVNPPGRREIGLPDLWAKPNHCPVSDNSLSAAFLAPPCPEAVAADDTGVESVNYRAEPIGLRVRNPATNTQTTGLPGDLSYAYQSRTDRADTAFNVQPSFYPPLTTGLTPGDPYTPLLRSFEGDQVKVRVLVGAHEEAHNFSIHGVKWLFEPDDKDSGYRNSQMMGISEWFDFEIPRVPSLAAGTSADFLYMPSSGTDSQWVGNWGILRVYKNPSIGTADTSTFSLVPLAVANPTGQAANPQTGFATISTSQARAEGVPGRDVDPASPVPTSGTATAGQTTSPVGAGNFTGNTLDLTKAAAPGTIEIACPVDSRLGRGYDITAVSAAEVLQNDPIGLPGLVYNARSASVSGPNGTFSGPLFDPTAIMFVFTSDLTYSGVPARPRLNQNVRREPIILRANAGDCIKVTFRNDLPKQYADAAGFTGVTMLTEGFNQNDVAPSQEISLHPQLVFYDIQRSDGSNVGLNPSMFGKQTAAPGEVRTYYWYAGDIQSSTVLPIEFGATGLSSADPIKHSNKGLVGELIIEPPTATWALDQDSHLKTTRASATVTSSNASFRPFHEFAFVLQDDVNLQFAGGAPVPSLVVDDDPNASGQKAINYRAEPLWYRAGWGPETPVTGNSGFTTRQFTQFDQILHNSWVGGDPETPVFQAKASEVLRFRVVMPGGHSQAHVFEAYGHPWLERPYVTGSNSTQIGVNATSELFGTRGGVGASDHFDGLVLDGAGGKFRVVGDYLYKDYPGPRLDAGIWGLLRIVP
jgi:hypothetical protein